MLMEQCPACRGCYIETLERRKECPMCFHPVAGAHQLQLNSQLQDMISQQWIRCPEEKRAKLPPAASMTVEELRKELRQRGLEIAGIKTELVPRLDKDRTKDAGCPWKGWVGKLTSHKAECEWVPVKCPNQGCADSPPRKDVPAHEARCEWAPVKCLNCEDSPLRKDALAHTAECDKREVACRHCGILTERRALAAHEGSCPFAEIECPNAGCSEAGTRAGMPLHRAECEHEEVACLSPKP